MTRSVGLTGTFPVQTGGGVESETNIYSDQVTVSVDLEVQLCVGSLHILHVGAEQLEKQKRERAAG